MPHRGYPIDPRDHIGLVKAIARRHAGRGVELDDLIGWGCLGLMRAVRAFDPERLPAERFGSFAFAYIRFEIEGAFDGRDAIHIPARIRHLAARVRKGLLDLEDIPPAGDGFPALRESVADALTVVGLRRVGRSGAGHAGDPLGSLADPLDADDPDDDPPPEVLRWVSDQESLVIQWHAGLDGGPGRPLGVVAGILGMPPNRARNAWRVALGKIRRRIAGGQWAAPRAGGIGDDSATRGRHEVQC